MASCALLPVFRFGLYVAFTACWNASAVSGARCLPPSGRSAYTVRQCVTVLWNTCHWARAIADLPADGPLPGARRVSVQQALPVFEMSLHARRLATDERS